jgi:O-antigen/teichoic acid export membrane protein
MLMTVFLFAVNRIAMPVASELFGSGSEKEMEYVYKSIAKWSLMVALPMFFILFFYPQNIISFFFGKEYLEAANVLRILAVGFFVNSISGSFGEFFQSYGKTLPIFIISVTGTILNLTLMAILIPKFGIEGAAFALASSLLWMCLLGNICMYYYKRILPFSREYLKAIVLGTVIFTGGYLLQSMLVKTVADNYILTGGIVVMSLLIYLPALYIFALNEFDRQVLLRIRRRFHIAPKTTV